MDMTPKDILDVRFREKVRGYHQADVDEFVSKVSATVAALQERAEAAESKLARLEATQQSSEADDTLRRTLVLAQRTADLAISEARDEATRLVAEAEHRRDLLIAEAADLRERLHAELEDEVRAERERLYSLRDALQADVEALEGHLVRERERLRIYFTDQLRRVEEGHPGLVATPVSQAPPGPSVGVDATDEPDIAQTPTAGTAMDEEDDQHPPVADEDAFLAELRRAVNDEEPLGPRDTPPPEDDGAGFDMFAPDSDDSGRFGSRRRRRR